MTMVRNPSFGPKVAMSAGGIDPMMLKNKSVAKESHHPSSKSAGPRVPNASVATPTLTLIKMVKRSLGG